MSILLTRAWRQPFALLTACVVLVSGWVIWWQWTKGTRELELPRSALVLQGGRLCRAGQSEPFTGWMVEWYPGGALKSRSRVQDGLLHGPAEGWYTNGQIQVREHFRAGISHGLRTKWYPNGATMAQAEIVDGQLQGRYCRWQEDGMPAERLQMHQGRPEGEAWSFYPSGCVKTWAKLSKGEVLEKRSWADGQQNAPDIPRAPAQ